MRKSIHMYSLYYGCQGLCFTPCLFWYHYSFTVLCANLRAWGWFTILCTILCAWGWFTGYSHHTGTVAVLNQGAMRRGYWEGPGSGRIPPLLQLNIPFLASNHRVIVAEHMIPMEVRTMRAQMLSGFSSIISVT